MGALKSVGNPALLVLCLSVVAVALITRTNAAEAAGPTISANVVNTLSHPVPVSGNVAVTNTASNPVPTWQR